VQRSDHTRAEVFFSEGSKLARHQELERMAGCLRNLGNALPGSKTTLKLHAEAI